jgi:hypothetical protein
MASVAGKTFSPSERLQPGNAYELDLPHPPRNQWKQYMPFNAPFRFPSINRNGFFRLIFGYAKKYAC